MAYKPEVVADASGKWFSNSLVFATEAEASAYVQDLQWRWTSVRDTRVVEVPAPVTVRWVNDRCVHLSMEAPL